MTMLNYVLVARPEWGDWVQFQDPLDILGTHRIDEVVNVLTEVERRVRSDGLYAAGFVSYEAASAFDPALSTALPGRLPLLCFGLFERPLPGAAPLAGVGCASGWSRPSSPDYYRALACIKSNIAVGNVYQVNHTIRLRAPSVSAHSLFNHIANGAAYGALVDADDYALVCASPELFFRLDGERLTSRPMKGTASRGFNTKEDSARRDWLAGSEKNRAENLMITDMVRNDMGKVARVGSVRVGSLFEVEQHPTVWQMTSTVSADTDASIVEIFRAMFPGASITGAPKRASMEQIVALEDSPREIYTGCIGYLAPGRQAQFNIAIRTAWIDKPASCMSYGVGGGIVWDSRPDEELEELVSKSKVLGDDISADGFELLETMRWTPERGIYNEAWHLERLQRSASYFGFAYDRERAIRAVEDALCGADGCRRVRMLLRPDGSVAVTHDVLRLNSATQELVLAETPVDANDVRLLHKTTDRAVYERADRAALPHQEVLLYNTDGNVTESTIANLVYRYDGKLYTPPEPDGLLPGTMRARLLHEGRIGERSLAVNDLARVERLYLINSLRGWRRARLPVGLA